jgi:large subunit ribosomal protein L17
MRHRNHSKRLARKPHQARSLLKNLVTSIILYEKVRTTLKRAQVAKGIVDTVITIGKRDRTDLAIRKMNKYLSHENASRKVLEVLKKRYASRSSGFSRVVPVGMRKGDGAKLVDIILIDAAVPVAEKKDEKKAVAAKKHSHVKA